MSSIQCLSLGVSNYCLQVRGSVQGRIVVFKKGKQRASNSYKRFSRTSQEMQKSITLLLLGCDFISRRALAPVATGLGCPSTGANAQTANFVELASHKITASPCNSLCQAIELQSVPHFITFKAGERRMRA